MPHYNIYILALTVKQLICLIFLPSVIMCAAAPVIFQMTGNTWEELQPLLAKCSCTVDTQLDGRPAIPQKLSISLPQ